MDFRTVATLAGYKSHYTADNAKTLCGRDVSNSTDGHDMCKACIKAAAKLTEQRDRLEYNTRAAETQDDVMQAAPRDAEGTTYVKGCEVESVSRRNGRPLEKGMVMRIENGRPVVSIYGEGDELSDVRPDLFKITSMPVEPTYTAGQPVDIMVTIKGETDEFRAAHVPNGNPADVDRRLAWARQAPTWTNVRAVNTPQRQEAASTTGKTVKPLMIHFGYDSESVQCGSSDDTEYGSVCTLTLANVTCEPCKAAHAANNPLAAPYTPAAPVEPTPATDAHRRCEHRKTLTYDHAQDCPVFTSGAEGRACTCHYSDARCTELDTPPLDDDDDTAPTVHVIQTEAAWEAEIAAQFAAGEAGDRMDAEQDAERIQRAEDERLGALYTDTTPAIPTLVIEPTDRTHVRVTVADHSTTLQSGRNVRLRAAIWARGLGYRPAKGRALKWREDGKLSLASLSLA